MGLIVKITARLFGWQWVAAEFGCSLSFYRVHWTEYGEPWIVNSYGKQWLAGYRSQGKGWTQVAGPELPEWVFLGVKIPGRMPGDQVPATVAPGPEDL